MSRSRKARSFRTVSCSFRPAADFPGEALRWRRWPYIFVPTEMVFGEALGVSHGPSVVKTQGVSSPVALNMFSASSLVPKDDLIIMSRDMPWTVKSERNVATGCTLTRCHSPGNVILGLRRKSRRRGSLTSEIVYIVKPETDSVVGMSKPVSELATALTDPAILVDPLFGHSLRVEIMRIVTFRWYRQIRFSGNLKKGRG